MDKLTFRQIQDRFVEQLRNPEKSVTEPWLTNIDGRRLAVYQRLLRNNIFRFIDSAFPVLKKLSDQQQWAGTQERFFCTFSSQSPYFTGIAENFVAYLQSHDELFVFASELAHYEWAELSVAQKTLPIHFVRIGRELPESQTIALNPTAIVASYQYPVDEISLEFRPQEPLAESRFLVIFRDIGGKTRFIRINAMTHLLLSELKAQERIQLKHFFQILPELLPQWPEEQIRQGAQQTLQQFAEQDLLLVVKN